MRSARLALALLACVAVRSAGQATPSLCGVAEYGVETQFEVSAP